MKQTCILVLGMHRSGTSALTGLLSMLEVYLGNELMEGNFANTKGYFENNSLYKTNENLLESTLAAAFKVNSKWGNINSSISGTTLLLDPTKYNIDIRTKLSIRIIKGLSFQLSGGGSFIRNQINLKNHENIKNFI